MKAYNCLGESKENKNERKKLKEEYVRRLRLIFNTQLSEKNKTLAIAILRNSFGIINWSEEEIQKLYRKSRNMLTIHGHHPRADIDNLCSQKRQRKRTDAERRSLHSTNYETDGMCYNTPTSKKLNATSNS
jgi:hypothetical protein